MLHGLLHGHDALDVLLLVAAVDGAAQDELEKAAQLARIAVLSYGIHIRHVEVIDMLAQHLVTHKQYQSSMVSGLRWLVALNCYYKVILRVLIIGL